MLIRQALSQLSHSTSPRQLFNIIQTTLSFCGSQAGISASDSIFRAKCENGPNKLVKRYGHLNFL
jgi:hypothetical protein